MPKRKLEDPAAEVNDHDWQRCYNVTDETIPGYAAMQFAEDGTGQLRSPGAWNSTFVYGGEPFIRVKKPDAELLKLSRTEQAARLWINGPSPILPQQPGRCTRMWPTPAIVLIADRTDHSLAKPGASLGFVAGEWYLTLASSKAGFPDPSIDKDVGPGIANLIAVDGRDSTIRSVSVGPTEFYVPRPMFIDQLNVAQVFCQGLFTGSLTEEDDDKSETVAGRGTEDSEDDSEIMTGNHFVATPGVFVLNADGKTIRVNGNMTLMVNCEATIKHSTTADSGMVEYSHQYRIVRLILKRPVKNDDGEITGYDYSTWRCVWALSGFQYQKFLISTAPTSGFSKPGVLSSAVGGLINVKSGDELRWLCSREIESFFGDFHAEDVYLVRFAMMQVESLPELSGNVAETSLIDLPGGEDRWEPDGE